MSVGRGCLLAETDDQAELISHSKRFHVSRGEKNRTVSQQSAHFEGAGYAGMSGC